MCHQEFAPPRVRYSEYGDLANRWMRADKRLDLTEPWVDREKQYQLMGSQLAELAGTPIAHLPFKRVQIRQRH
jgi:hypothetical protein